MDTKDGKKLIGEKLRHYRVNIAGIESREKFAEKIKLPGKNEPTSRGYIAEVETGVANPTIEFIEAFVNACGRSLQQFLRGFTPEDVKVGHQIYHEMLDTILSGEEDDEFVIGIKANLKALSETVTRMRGNAREQPSPDQAGRGADKSGNRKRKA